ncbi:stress response small protein YobI [Escherichia coli]
MCIFITHNITENLIFKYLLPI